MDTDKKILFQLVTSLHAVEKVYDVAIYGKNHREVILLNLKAKIDSKAPAALNRKDLSKAVKEIEAIRESKKEQLSHVNFTVKEVNVIKKSLNFQLRLIRSIPMLARYQAVIALSASFEGFITDSIKYVYDKQPNVLKSGKYLESGDKFYKKVLKPVGLKKIKY